MVSRIDSPLTTRQKQIYDFVVEYWRANYVTPRHRDIIEEFGFKSPSAVTSHVQALEAKGYVIRSQGKIVPTFIASAIPQLISHELAYQLWSPTPDSVRAHTISTL